MNIIGYCKECSTRIRHEDKIEDTQIYECPKCKHPQTAEEVEFGPFEVKKPEEENIIEEVRKIIKEAESARTIETLDRLGKELDELREPLKLESQSLIENEFVKRYKKVTDILDYISANKRILSGYYPK